ncbi:putative sodium-dependent multivitamin transporter isoform X2 [Condylostylus longicornis]|nr:putative sodium-dependent multivitamin transporter isoform X2 [Condylostylus longicornis]
MGTFSTWDYVVFSLVLVISAGIGVYFRLTGGKQKTTKEYLLADKSMSTLPVAFSLMASFMSAITLLGVSTENYQFGTMFVIINISYIISTPIAAYLFLPVFYRMNTTSVYEYLEKRFGKAARLCASLAYSIQMILYMGIVLYAPALALEAVTGIGKTAAILTIGIICTFYSTIGGMKTVIFTDVFQSILMFAAIYSVIITAAIKAGGLAPIWEIAVADKRVEFLNFDLDPTTRHTWWSLIIGGMVTYLSLYGVNQVQIQRLLTVRNLKSSQSSLWMNIPILSLLSFSTSFSGLAIYYYYRKCDPYLEKRINSRDQIMPLFVLDTMGDYPGLSGLFVSGIFSASLSTVSSAVSSLAAVTLEDYFKPLYRCVKKNTIHDDHSSLSSKIMACVYGFVCIGLAFVAQSMGGVLQASLTIFGIVGGPLLALFTLGMCTTRANQKGVLIGLFIGLAFSFWIGFGISKPPPKTLDFTTEGCPIKNFTQLLETQALTQDSDQYLWISKISYLWYSVLGFIISFTLGYIFSIIMEKLKFDLNDQIYINSNRNCLNYDLFIPPLATYLKGEAVNRLAALDNISNNNENLNGLLISDSSKNDYVENDILKYNKVPNNDQFS